MSPDVFLAIKNFDCPCVAAFDATEMSKLNVSTRLMHYQMIIITRTHTTFEKTPTLIMGELITETKQKEPVLRFFNTLVEKFGQLCLPRIIVLDYVPSTIEILIGVFNSGVLKMDRESAFAHYKELMESNLEDPETALNGLVFVVSCKKHLQSNVTNKGNYSFKPTCSQEDIAFLVIVLKVLMHEQDYNTSMALWKKILLMFSEPSAKIATETYLQFIKLYNNIVKDGNGGYEGDDEPDRVKLRPNCNNSNDDDDGDDDDDDNDANRYHRADMKRYFEKLFGRRYLYGGVTRYYLSVIFGATNSDLIDNTAHVERKFGDLKANRRLHELSIVEYIPRALELCKQDLLAYYEVLRSSRVKNRNVQAISTILGVNQTAIQALKPLFSAVSPEKPDEKWKRGSNKTAQAKSMLANLRTSIIKQPAPSDAVVALPNSASKKQKIGRAAKAKKNSGVGTMLGANGKMKTKTQKMVTKMELIQLGAVFADQSFLVRIRNYPMVKTP
jgi:hypothetical protein